jgi:hypothetical protein
VISGAPTTAIFNLNNFPSDVLQCYLDYQDHITKTLSSNALTPFVDPITGVLTNKYHVDPFSIGKHVIILTGAILEESPVTKPFF